MHYEGCSCEICIQDYWMNWEDNRDEDCRTHGLDCECEDCMQNYPERFFEEDDGTWTNIHRVEDD